MSIETHNSATESSLATSAAAEKDSVGIKDTLLRLGSLALMPAVTLTIGISLGNSERIGNNLHAALSFDDQNNAMSEIASEVADMPLRVNCSDEEIREMTYLSEDGSTEYVVRGFVEPINLLFAPYAPPVMTLSEEVCDSVLNSGFESFDSVYTPVYSDYIAEMTAPASALATVLHEAEHNKQVFNEAEATCYAVQKLPEALEELGMASEDATVVARQVLYDTINGNRPSEYYSEECITGGDYDLGINDLYVLAPESNVAVSQ